MKHLFLASLFFFLSISTTLAHDGPHDEFGLAIIEPRQTMLPPAKQSFFELYREETVLGSFLLIGGVGVYFWHFRKKNKKLS